MHNLNAKIDQLRIFIEILKTLGYECSDICIEEFWIWIMGGSSNANKEIKKGDSLNKTVDLVHLYRPPNDIIEKYNEFAREIYPLSKTLETSNYEAIISGYLNIDFFFLNNEKQSFCEYFSTLTSCRFYP